MDKSEAKHEFYNSFAAQLVDIRNLEGTAQVQIKNIPKAKSIALQNLKLNL